MRIDILTVLPNLLDSPFSNSILQRAIDKGIAEVHIHDIRKFSLDKHHKVDDYQYGGGAGMVLTCQPLADCIESLTQQRSYDAIIYLTPDGETLKQSRVNQLSTVKNIMMICGHYKGIDERIRELYVTLEISIGDYVLSGGELAAAVLSDAIIRVIPGAISNEMSALTDSFQDNLLSHPVYTRPDEFRGLKVPEVLLSGDFKKIEEWREKKSYERTQQRRPDLLEGFE
ncbi:MAG: tRNA ((37)-N(1))-methyltransferase [Bacteroidota bacterium]|jgi:tRNA (guanine37-N1)-methyltransferase